jgi:hypothetical protein
MRFLQACASSQRAAAADAAVDDSTLLTAVGYEKQARARRRAFAVFVKACSKQPLGCAFNGAFSSLFDFFSFVLCCSLTYALFAGLRVVAKSGSR